MNTYIKRKSLIIKIALLALALAVGAAWMTGTNKTKAEPVVPAVSRPALTVRTTMLRDAHWGRTLTAEGSILPWQEAVISAQVQGVRLAEVQSQHRRSCKTGRCAGDAGQFCPSQRRSRGIAFRARPHRCAL